MARARQWSPVSHQRRGTRRRGGAAPSTASGWPSGPRRQTQGTLPLPARGGFECSGPRLRAWVQIPLLTLLPSFVLAFGGVRVAASPSQLAPSRVWPPSPRQRTTRGAGCANDSELRGACALSGPAGWLAGWAQPRQGRGEDRPAPPRPASPVQAASAGAVLTRRCRRCPPSCPGAPDEGADEDAKGTLGSASAAPRRRATKMRPTLPLEGLEPSFPGLGERCLIH